MEEKKDTEPVVEEASTFFSLFSTLDLAILVGCLVLFGIYLWSKRKQNDSSSGPPAFKMITPQVQSQNDPSFVNKMKNTGRNIVIFYGSQTGTGEDFANRLVKEAVSYGMKGVAVDPEEQNMEELKDLGDIEKSLAIFCLATYGEGDPTDNAQEFYDWLQATDMQLSGLRYSVFGLGNKTYEHYNAMGIYVDKRLAELGAQRVYQIGLGDDDSSIEEDFVTWKEGLWPAICECFGISSEMQDIRVRQYEVTEYSDNSVPDKVYKGEIGRLGSFDTQKPPFDAKNPFLAPIAVNRELHKGGDRSCLHIELDITGSRMRYETGDHVAIFPVNDAEIVDRIGQRLGVDLDSIFSLKNLDEDSNKKHPFPCPCSYRTALSYYLDIIHTPKTNLLRELAEYAQDPTEKEFLKLIASSTPEGKSKYKEWIVNDHRDLLSVLEDLPSVSAPLHHLAELLPRLQARYYSISSSPKMYPNSVHITAAVVLYNTRLNREVKGVATTWLASKRPVGEERPRVPIFIRRSQLRLPYKATTPLVMVGPGTGIAPFRGFIQERLVAKRNEKPVGEMILYFGCRRRAEDYIYEDEMDEAMKEGSLSKVHAAFSRDQESKCYVQHLMKKEENKKEIWSILDKGGHFYICGDARNMARDVLATLEDLIISEGGMSKAEAQDYIKKMHNKGRYAADVWS